MNRKKMAEQFKTIIEDAMKKYESKKAKYGETWKEMSIEELRDRLWEEINELETSQKVPELTSLKEYNELIDVVNCCMMLAVRIKEDNR